MIEPPSEASRTAVALIARLPLRKMLQITVKKLGKLLQSHRHCADGSVLEKGSYFVLLASAGG